MHTHARTCACVHVCVHVQMEDFVSWHKSIFQEQVTRIPVWCTFTYLHDMMLCWFQTTTVENYNMHTHAHTYMHTCVHTHTHRCTVEPVTKGHNKNGTMHSKFQLRNLTIFFLFNERTNNYLQKNDIEKITETKPVQWTWRFPSCNKRSGVMIRHENNRVLFFDLFVYNSSCILKK